MSRLFAHRFALASGFVAMVLAPQVWVWAQPSVGHAPPGFAKAFEGYWMGIDPLDGGDSRRSIIRLDDGQFAMAGRDTVLTLCDETDRGLISFSDGELQGRNVMESSTATIACSNTGASVTLRLRYELIRNGVIVEESSTPAGTLVSRIVFHRVSQVFPD